jgi:hypothetical protein
LLLARDIGLETLEVAAELALESGVITAPVIMNAMRRLTAPARPQALENTPRLTVEPLADCSRYDSLLREVRHVH